MDKINPLLYVTDTDPVPEAVLDASGWFETEYATWMYSTGPALIGTSNSTTDLTPWFMAQGWTVYDRVSVRLGTASAWEVTIYFKRRKLQSERVLNDMIREFTDAYNEGRSINDQRYDEIVTIYNVMLDKSENEMRSLIATSNDYDSLIQVVVNKLEGDWTTHNTSVTALLDGFGDSRIDEINVQFDNKLTEARSGLVGRGMFNTTTWDSISAGIERERQKALSDLSDKITDKKISVYDRLYQAKDSMRKSIMATHERLLASKRENAITPLDFRNKILSAMLAFMERRTDEYPGLDGLAGIAAQLGFSEGAATVAPSA
jgi:hypothetical protein